MGVSEGERWTLGRGGRRGCGTEGVLQAPMVGRKHKDLRLSQTGRRGKTSLLLKTSKGGRGIAHQRERGGGGAGTGQKKFGSRGRPDRSRAVHNPWKQKG